MNKLKRKHIKGLFITAISVILICGILYGLFIGKVSDKSSIVIPLGNENAVIESGTYSFEDKGSETVTGIRSNDTIYTYKVLEDKEKIGTLTFTIREIVNGDQIVFSKFENSSSEGKSIPIRIKLENTDDYQVYSFVDEEPVREHDKVFGKDLTSNVKGLYRMTEDKEQKYDLYLSQNYISRELTMSYDETHDSTLRELISEDKYIDIQQGKDDLTFNLLLRTTDGGQISENWFMFSNNQLFNDIDVLEQYKETTNYNFVHNPKWSTGNGNYTKLPWSIEPGTTLGYGRNLVALQDNTALEYYLESDETFFYNMLINSVNNLINFRASDKELWETEYTSTWLKKDYGIIAPYTDTRHNEKVALFLTEVGKKLGIEEIEDSFLLYAEFLSEQQEIGNVIETENGYYIADYYSDQQEKKTHVSLNHALGEMNFLLETYKETAEEKYLNTALAIKVGVEETGLDWINPSNGDLWYQINGDYTFEGEDYPTLTLDDLTVSLTLFKEMDIQYSSVLNQLIESKVSYVIEENIPVDKSTVTRLIDLGLGDQIADYDNIIDY